MLIKKKYTLGYSPYGNYEGNIYPFNDIFKENVNLKHGFKDVDCVVLWGGTDIHPSFYKQKAHPYNSSPRTGPSERDIFEWKVMLWCRANKIPMIGICRGAQFGCIAAGGSLIQHVEGHCNGNHPVTTGKDVFHTNSVHHQMMDLRNVPHTLFAWCESPLSNRHDGETVDQQIPVEKEPEIAYLPGIKMFAIQGHPEYSSAPSTFQEFCLREVADTLNFVD